MSTLDRIHQKYGRGAVSMASAGNRGAQREWVTRQDRRTPDYTTCWECLPIAKA